MRVTGLWVVYPAGAVRISTLVMGIAILGLIGVVRRRPVAALVAAVAWLAAYEIAWEVARVPFGQDTARDAIGFVPLVVGWLWAARAWGIGPDLRWTLLAAAAFALWVATGYQQNWSGRPINVDAEIFNEVSKTALGIAYLLGAWRLQPLARRRPGVGVVEQPTHGVREPVR